MLELQVRPPAGTQLRPATQPWRDLPPLVQLPIRPARPAPAPAPTAADRDASVARHSHLVKFVVGRLRVSIDGVFDAEDALQAGMVGLLRAIDDYRPESASSFESYALLRIRGAIIDAVRSLDPVGRGGRAFIRAAAAASGALQAELGRVPTDGEIAARLGIPVDRYRARRRESAVVTVSLDSVAGRDDHSYDSEDGDGPAGAADDAVDLAAVDPEVAATHRDDLVRLAREIGRLGVRQRQVVSMYYGDELTFRQIGAALGLTESRICQIHTALVRGLRSRFVEPAVAARAPRPRRELPPAA